MKELIAELIGTCLLITLGCGSVANSLLSKSKGQNTGWLSICIAWGFSVMIAIYAVGSISGAHLNPAITIGLASIGKLPLEKVPYYIIGQFLGAMLGAVIVWICYLPHWAQTKDADLKLAVFCTDPAIKHTFSNFISEFIASAVLIFGILTIGKNEFFAGFQPFIIGLLIITIGLSLGGTTGWALNPARDFGPRLVHFLLPIPQKRDSNWSYAWIPVVAPIVGCVFGAFLFQLLF